MIMSRFMSIPSFVLLIVLLLNTTCFAKELTLVTGFSKPPYSLVEQNKGFELELIQLIFKNLDYRVSFVTAPFGRSQKMFKIDGVEGVTTAKIQLYRGNAHITEPYIIYHNAVISLASKKIQLSAVNELSRYSVAAFQNSQAILGSEYSQAVAESPKFVELADQKNQLNMLSQGEIDLLVMDINIFNYYNKTFNLDYTVHELFEPTPYGLLIKDTNLIKPINQQISQLVKSAQYSALATKWHIPNRLLIQ